MKSKIFLALALISLGAFSCVSPKKLQEAEAKYGQLNGAYADLQSKYRDAQDATSKAKNDGDKIATEKNNFLTQSSPTLLSDSSCFLKIFSGLLNQDKSFKLSNKLAPS